MDRVLLVNVVCSLLAVCLVGGNRPEDWRIDNMHPGKYKHQSDEQDIIDLDAENMPNSEPKQPALLFDQLDEAYDSDESTISLSSENDSNLTAETDNYPESGNRTEVTDDDEDLGSGSGSGDVIDWEDELNTTTLDLELQTNNSTNRITLDTSSGEDNGDVDFVLKTDEAAPELLPTTTASTENPPTTQLVTEHNEETPLCKELTAPTWTPWSPWVRSGDVDIRFRRCPVKHAYTTDTNTCVGDYIEVRQCRQKNVQICRSPFGTYTEEYDVTCDGLDWHDIIKADELSNSFWENEKCEYALYDLKYNLQIGEKLSTDELLVSANPTMWCFSRNKYIPFHTNTPRCLRHFQNFCTVSKECNYEKTRKTLKHKGDLKKLCWEKFVLGGVLPKGFEDSGGFFLMCQKFDKSSSLGVVLGHKQDYYATMYDIFRRIPLYSVAVVSQLTEEKWPIVPHMIEHGLIDEKEGAMSWFFRDKKRGLIDPAELKEACSIPSCELGRKQALPVDYEETGYRIAPLVTPDLIGGDLAKRVSTFALTNSAPMNPTMFQKWTHIISTVRNYAINECNIPVGEANNKTHSKEFRSRHGHEYPEMYVVSGTVPSITHEEVIGNDVNVPTAFWTASCCAKGADVSAFGVYMKNDFEGFVKVLSVKELQYLLQVEYNQNNATDVNLFPAFDQVCDSPQNDASNKVIL